MRECAECDYLEYITNSDGDTIYICADTSSGAYLEETGVCGNCDLDDGSEC